MGMLDDMDKAILAELVEDSQKTIRELATKLKVHPNTLLQRVKKLENNKVIKKYTTVVDYGKLGYNLEAIIFIDVKMGKGWETSLKNVIEKIPELSSVMLVTGEHDALAIAKVKDKDELTEVLRKIQDNEVVVKTTTHILLAYQKEPYQFNPLLKEKK